MRFLLGLIKLLLIAAALFFAYALLRSPYIQNIKYEANITIATSTTEITAPPAPIHKATTTKQTKKPEATPLSLATTPQIAAPIRQLVSFDMLDKRARAATVNILCTTKTGGYFKPVSGSGVMIDRRGVILTNAHVAQFFLLRDYITSGFITCEIRTGNPASPSYSAKLLYIPEQWLSVHANEITKSESLSTGQYDFALLLITEKITQNAPNVGSAQFLEPDPWLESAEAGEPVLLSSYPAELIGAIATQKDLYRIGTTATITDAYYFEDGDAGKLDVFALSQNLLAQAGSSGGAVASGYTGKLIGLIVTSSSGNTTNQKTLRAISLAHVSRSMSKFIGKDLSEYLSQDLTVELENYSANTFPKLKETLEKVLKR